jgi:Domain of unknown function (DUF4190)
MSYNDPYQQQQPQPQYPYQQQQQQPQYQYPAQGYPPPGYAPPSTAGTTNTMAILSLVFAFVFWPAGIVLGHMAKKQIRERNEEGAGLATAGLIISYIFGAIGVVACGIWIIAVAVLASHGTTTTG